MKKGLFFLCLSLGLIISGYSQFEDYYNEFNWNIITLNTGPNTIPPGVEFNNTLETMTLTADGDFMGVSGTTMPAGIPFNCSWGDGLVQACIEIPADGTIDFDWAYTMQFFFEDPANEPFGYCINDNDFVSLVTPGQFSDQSGTESIEVSAGDYFCFVQASYFSEEFQAQTTVSDFSAPELPSTTNLLEDCYAEENWTVTALNSSGGATFGSNFISIQGDTDFSGTNLDVLNCDAVNGMERVCIEVPVTGDWSFNWDVNYPPLSNVLLDRFGYCLNGVVTELTSVNPMPFGTTSGTETVSLEVGDDFCFILASKFADSGLVTATINSFILPDCIVGYSVEAEVSSNFNICFGDENGSIDLEVSAAVGDVTYDWDSPLAMGSNPTGLPAGTYCVTITDEDDNELFECFEITEPEELILDGSLISNVSCYGAMDGSVQIEILGGTPDFDIVWENGGDTEVLAELDGGSYDVTVEDSNGCIAETTVNVDEPTAVELNLSATASTGEDGTITAEVIGGDGPFNYSIDGVNFTSSNVFDELAPGEYEIAMYDSNNCFFYETIVVELSNAIADLTGENYFEVYPNPSSNFVHLQSSGLIAGDYQLSIYDALGKLQLMVNSYELQESNLTLDLRLLSSGTYILRIAGDDFSQTIPLIVKP